MNTSVTGTLIPAMRRAGLDIAMLIHELPTLIKEYKLEPNLELIAEECKYTVFPSQLVKDGYEQFVTGGKSKKVIHPQGLYLPIKYSADKRAAIRAELGIPTDAKVVLNVGFADLRKGFDIFLETARQIIAGPCT